MKTENADQDELQRMLARKRHDQPPPRFFKGLSSAVIDRIQNPEPPLPPTLRQRLGLDFDTKPVLVCVSGLAVLALLAYGLIHARDAKPPTADENAGEPAARLVAGPGPAEAGAPLRTPATKPGEPPRSLAPVKISDAGDRMSVQPLAPPSTPAVRPGN